MTDGARRLRECAQNFGARWDELAGIAVSGGSDSVAMLHLLADTGRPFEAVTVDHGLRDGSRAEAEFVADLCRGLGVPHHILTWQRVGHTGNIQDQARRARYSLMRDWARARGIRVIALGHTLDDQAETFVMNLARRAGLDGLSAMIGWRTDGDVVWARPFLSVRRSDLQDHLRRRGIAWCDDPSNLDDRFRRVQARRALDLLQPLGIDAEVLGDVAAHLRDVRVELDTRVLRLFQGAARIDWGDLVFARAALTPSIGGETYRRALIAALRWVTGADYPPRSDSVAELAEAISRNKAHTLSGCLVTTTASELRFTREWNAVRDLETPADDLWDGRWRLDGPHAPDLTIRALGEGVTQCPDWRATGLPRASLTASPAIWRRETLVAAPLAGLANGWTATLTDNRRDFARWLI